MSVPAVKDNRPILLLMIYSRCFRQRRPQSHCRERHGLKDKQKPYISARMLTALIRLQPHCWILDFLYLAPHIFILRQQFR